MDKKKVVILGAGFGGVRVALDLAKEKNIEIVLVNDSEFHCFHADLYEVATAFLEQQTKLEYLNLRSTVNIPLEAVFKDKDIKILVDKIDQINLPERTVRTTAANLSYDYLVLGLGSETDYFGIDGAEDFSYPIKTAEDALNIHNELKELLSRKQDSFSLIIAGGGFTGVELAGEMTKFLPPPCQITIVEGSETVLPGMPRWAQQAALKRLDSLGVKVRLNQLIEKVEKGKVFCKNSATFDYDFLIWTAGVRGEDLEGQIEGIKLTERGQLEVGSDMSLQGYPEVFVVGDMAELIDSQTGLAVPQTAWVAVGQAKVIARNIKNRLVGEKTESYHPPTPAFVVPIGSKFALSNAFGFRIKGLAGWFLKRMISLKYLLSILPVARALELWFKGTIIFQKND